jgi:hypothetical protein
MEWEQVTARAGQLTEGRFYAYLVAIDPDGPAAVLTRFHKGHLGHPGVPMPLAAAAHAAASAIRFECRTDELSARIESAKAHAERFEATEGQLPWRPDLDADEYPLGSRIEQEN